MHCTEWREGSSSAHPYFTTISLSCRKEKTKTYFWSTHILWVLLSWPYQDWLNPKVCYQPCQKWEVLCWSWHVYSVFYGVKGGNPQVRTLPWSYTFPKLSTMLYCHHISNMNFERTQLYLFQKASFKWRYTKKALCTLRITKGKQEESIFSPSATPPCPNLSKISP